MKPNKAEREQLDEILATPLRLTGQKLTSEESNTLWKFRGVLLNNKKALTRFVVCVDWEDETELVLASHLLEQWTEVDVADVLRLLSGEVEFRHAIVREHAVRIMEGYVECVFGREGDFMIVHSI